MNDREHVVATYRKSAARYDLTSRLNLALGPQRAHRRRAVRALGLRPGDTVVELGCGTGLNFPLIERDIGPGGHLIGVDLTDAMLAQAQQRIEANGWSNVTLVHSDAAEFEFPPEVDAILATYAHSLLPAPRQVIAKGTAALSTGGRMAVLDVKVPAAVPRWLTRRRYGVEAWAARRPWEEIRAAMQDTLVDVSWTELFFGSAYLAAGSRPPDQSPQNRGESA
jgi:demethylmenaquinone methyltransferase/2-methoxy-6-polyprenyl-1,4-benzoquinol methylase